MTLSADAMVAITDRMEILEAAFPVMYDALMHVRKLANDDQLKLHLPTELLFKIRDAAKQATDAIDAVTDAEKRRGMEAKDAETMLALNAYGYSALSSKGKLEAIAAQKRIERDKAQTLRQHGVATLRLVREETKAQGIDPFAEFPAALNEDNE